MKTKDELIKMLRNGEIKDFNQYRFHRPNEVIDLRWAVLNGANLSSAVLSSADLNGADLNGANLSSAVLSGADLSSANLSSADLSGANLSSADLSDANLRRAVLNGADLNGADLDFASLHLSCRSLRFKSDEKQRVQIAFHFASLIANCENATDEEKEIYKNILPYVNKFHRTDVKRLTELNQSK